MGFNRKHKRQNDVYVDLCLTEAGRWLAGGIPGAEIRKHLACPPDIELTHDPVTDLYRVVWNAPFKSLVMRPWLRRVLHREYPE